jgi:hypothetical protein
MLRSLFGINLLDENGGVIDCMAYDNGFIQNLKRSISSSLQFYKIYLFRKNYSDATLS